MSRDDGGNRFNLNKYTHTIRPNQIIYRYGPGAIIDFPDQSLMTAAPEFWESSIRKIEDERLAKSLNVNYFGEATNEPPKPIDHPGISYVRFPEWYFCPRCRIFQPIGKWVDEYKRRGRTDTDPEMINRIRCTKCGARLVVSRIVSVCEHGHIDDFPWIKWVHARNVSGPKPICENGRLKIKNTTISSEGLEGVAVECNCGAYATLSGSMGTDAFEQLDNKTNHQYDFTCTGRHPWKHKTENCSSYPLVKPRGAASIYYPTTVSSLVIPPFSSMLTREIENSAAFDKCRSDFNSQKSILDMTGLSIKEKAAALQKTIDDGATKISMEIGADSGVIRDILMRKLDITDSEAAQITDEEYRVQEYEALTGRVDGGRFNDEFVREATDIDAYNLPFVKQISLISKVREVIALTGFSRLNPYEGSIEDKTYINVVPIKDKNTEWYPAYQVRGEGIFIELDGNAINEWRNRFPEVQDRADKINKSYNNSYFAKTQSRTITTKFLLLHTLAHLLIKQLSFECGYGIASLKERIYCSEASSSMEMSGIFIYTAGGDSEGTLGGLVRQGKSDVFPQLFIKAIESARMCSGDPVCSLSDGQGRDSINLAACYSCALIPETSCEHFNGFLDRGVLVGTMKRREFGFFADQLDNGWINTDYKAVAKQYKPAQAAVSQETSKAGEVVLIANSGVNLVESSWDEIKDALLGSCDDEEDKIISNANFNMFLGKEKPCMDMYFKQRDCEDEYSCTFVWIQSKVMFFTKDNVEGKPVAESSGWKCFTFIDGLFPVDAIRANLKEGK